MLSTFITNQLLYKHDCKPGIALKSLEAFVVDLILRAYKSPS